MKLTLFLFALLSDRVLLPFVLEDVFWFILVLFYCTVKYDPSRYRFSFKHLLSVRHIMLPSVYASSFTSIGLSFYQDIFVDDGGMT